MPVWQWLVDSAGVVLLIVAGYGLLLVLRRRGISRRGGTFELAVRVRSEKAGRGWVLGIGRYQAGQLQWFRIFSPSPLAKRSWSRTQLHIRGTREPERGEAYSLYGGHLVVECTGPEGLIELAMSPSALTGFSSWLEAGPPGADWNHKARRS